MGKKISKHGNVKHGYAAGSRHTANFRLHRVWTQMKQRCYNPNDQRYCYYGARGIKVCKRWQGKHGFENFIKDMGPRPESAWLDRIDNDGNYTPENCRWTSRKESQRNSRNNRMITYQGRTQCLIEWAEELDIPYKTLHDRLNKQGWTFERAVIQPVRKCSPRS